MGKETEEYQKPYCPYCGEKMDFWEVPPFPYEDGLGWGSQFLYVCFNDSCSLYAEGWETIKRNYGHHASYRCIQVPSESDFSCIMVFTSQGMRGNIVEKIVSHKSIISIYGKTVFMNDGDTVADLSIETYEKELKQFHENLAKKYESKG